MFFLPFPKLRLISSLVCSASNVFYLQILEITIISIYSLLKDLQQLLLAYRTEPKLLCLGVKALQDIISILLVLLLSWYSSTGNPLLQPPGLSPLHSPCPSYFLSLSILFLHRLFKTSDSAEILPLHGAVLKLLYSEHQMTSELQRVPITFPGIRLYMVI